MHAADIMTRTVMTIHPEAGIDAALSMMEAHHVSGLPVCDAAGNLVGIVTEGDLLRRTELGTAGKETSLLSLVVAGAGREAARFTKSHGRKVHEVMTTEVATVVPGTPLVDIVDQMQRLGVKRLPVVSGDRLVGIVARADLIRALGKIMHRTRNRFAASDNALRQRVLEEIDRLQWAPRAGVNPVVSDGVVSLWGAVTDERQRTALVVAVENLPGVKAVVDRIAWIEPLTGTVLDQAGDSHAAQ